MMSDIFVIINIILLTYLGIGSLYILIFSIASKFKLKSIGDKSEPQNRIAVFAPVYAENEVILEASAQNIKQNYPEDKFDLIVIADDLKESTIGKLKEMGAKVVEVHWGDDRTKAKSLNFALEQLSPVYDIAVVLDADNVMAPDVLCQFNAAYNHGWKAIQGHRAAKNRNTEFAILDAVSEEINNSIFRKGHRVLGLSSALIGSGMAFDYELFVDSMKQIDAVSGFDKELELVLLRDRVSIKYLDKAVILDEKIQKPDDFEKQRRRWIHAQINYLFKNSFKAVKALFTGNIDFFDKVLQFFLPPRLILLGSQLVLALTSLLLCIFFPDTNLSGVNDQFCLFWFISLGITVFSLWISIPSSFLKIVSLKSLIQLPFAFLLMVVSLFKNKSAKDKFIHTKHHLNDTLNAAKSK